MKFDFQRLTPAVLTSLGLVFLAMLFVSFGWIALGWIVGLLGIGLNVVAVAVTAVPDASESGTRRVAARPGAAQRSERGRLALRDSAAGSSARADRRDADADADAAHRSEAAVVRDADGQPVEASTGPMTTVTRDGKPGKGDKAAYSRAGSTAVPGSATSSSSAGRPAGKGRSSIRK